MTTSAERYDCNLYQIAITSFNYKRRDMSLENLLLFHIYTVHISMLYSKPNLCRSSAQVNESVEKKLFTL